MFSTSFLTRAVLAAAVLGTLLTTSVRSLSAEAPPQPIRALLVTGGCCHDYDTQKNLIKKGLEARARIEVTVVQQGGNSTDTRIPLYEDPKWAEGYDIVLHDECFAAVKDPAWTARVLAPHRQGLPAVVIHCAMHCYRDGTDQWFEFCGVTSHRHGAHYPHAVYNYNPQHPVMGNFGPAWSNPQGELYHIAKVWPTATVLGASKERDQGTEHACVWTNQYGPAKVFGTTLGHHNETVSDEKFLNLLTRGTLWACDKLNDDYLKTDPQQSTLVPVNLALGATATASSEETGKNNFAAKALDSDPGTRWCASNGSYPQWLQVDLKEPLKIDACKIVWESDSGVYQYLLQGSVNGKQWKTLVDRSDSKSSDHELKFDLQKIRFVKVQCLGNPDGGWASIRELQIFGEEKQRVDPLAIAKKRESHKLKEVKIPAGFEKTLLAEPPAVNYPVFVAAAPEGDVYVAVDKNGSLDREPMRGAVHRLRDIDGDGKADEVKLFVPNVDSPRGMVWDRDRLYVLHPPHLSAFIDDDGDGRSDRQEILIKNIAFTFEDRPADHTSNGVTLGIDGWLYLAIGDFGFMEAEGTDGTKLQMRGGGVVRVRPDGTNMEVYSEGTRNILEVAIDPRMNGFTRDNTNDGGGWDIRLHHFSGGEDHGYPRLFTNFGEEIVQPLADFGGGSGCGALYLQEPGFPVGYGNTLYTADWGRSWIYAHHPQRVGTTFEVDQEEFLGLPRVTDLDVDGASHIYAASWKGATFKYADENVGYVVRVSPKGYQAEPLPNLREADTQTLLNLLTSASHRRRLAAQRELLARDDVAAIDDRLQILLQQADVSLETKIAALYLRIQGLTSEQLVGTFLTDNNDPALLAIELRALTDVVTSQISDFDNLPRSNQIAFGILHQTLTEKLAASLASNHPRRRLEATIAVGKLHRKLGGDQPAENVRENEIWRALLDQLDSEDDLLRHTTFRVLASSEAFVPLLTVIDNPQASTRQRKFAMLALQRIHRAEVVDSVIRRLKRETNDLRKRDLLVALCRLYFVEGTWKGNSWGTRPDTRGPYYQPETWQESDKIAKVLRSSLENAPPAEAQFLLSQLQRHRVDLSGTLEVALRSAQQDPKFIPAAVAYLAKSPRLPKEAIELLTDVATADGTTAEVRSNAVIALLTSTDPEVLAHAFTGLYLLFEQDATSGPYQVALDAFHDQKKLERQMQALENLVENAKAPIASVAEAGLQFLHRQKKLSPEVKQTTDQLVTTGWQNDERLPRILIAVLMTNQRQHAPQVRKLLLSQNEVVRETASRVAAAWNIDPSMPKSTGPKIATLDPLEVIRQVDELPGNIERGKQLFAQLQCNKCHTVAPDQPLRGPYLPNVAKTYKRNQLTEAIVLPSKSLAQGFVTHLFQMDDGRLLSGFITLESPEVIVIRDEQGNEIKLNPEEIEGHRKGDISIMPKGLADQITPAELADLVSYLESLADLASQQP